MTGTEVGRAAAAGLVGLTGLTLAAMFVWLPCFAPDTASLLDVFAESHCTRTWMQTENAISSI